VTELLLLLSLSVLKPVLLVLFAVVVLHNRQVRNMLVPLMEPWVPLVCSTLTSDIKVGGWV
jgi:hypothetical protein